MRFACSLKSWSASVRTAAAITVLCTTPACGTEDAPENTLTESALAARTRCAGTTPEVSNWVQAGPNLLSLHVDTWQECGGFSGLTSSGRPHYFTSLIGQGAHRYQGVASIYRVRQTSFRVYIFGPGLTAESARQAKLRVNWEGMNSGRANHICAGRTPEVSNWKQHVQADGVVNNNLVELDINTGCGFTSTPRYITSLETPAETPWKLVPAGSGLQGSSHLDALGVSSIFQPSKTGFKVILRRRSGGPLRAENVRAEKWMINWYASDPGHPFPGDRCMGDSGSVPWVLDPNDPNAIRMSINTSQCGFTATPRHIVSLAGIGRHQRLVGSNAIISPSANGLHVFLTSPWRTAQQLLADATEMNWKVNWHATVGPNSCDAGLVCTPGASLRNVACGKCGLRQVFCGSSGCAGDEYEGSHCTKEGVCTAGVDKIPCGRTGTKTCSNQCTWSDAVCVGDTSPPIPDNNVGRKCGNESCGPNRYVSEQHGHIACGTRDSDGKPRQGLRKTCAVANAQFEWACGTCPSGYSSQSANYTSVGCNYSLNGETFKSPRLRCKKN